MTDQGKRHVIVCYTPRVSTLWPRGPTHLIRRAVEERLRTLGVSLMIFCFLFTFKCFHIYFYIAVHKIAVFTFNCLLQISDLERKYSSNSQQKEIDFFYFLGLRELYENVFLFSLFEKNSP